jgi:SAM-dependent methyltransferase
MMMQTKHRVCPVCSGDDTNNLFKPKASPGPVVQCKICGMVYVADIVDDHALIETGPVLGERDDRLLTSSNLADIEGTWEMQLLPQKEQEWSALRINAVEAFSWIERYSQGAGQPFRFLDFGSGWGFTLLAAKEKGWELYGIEPLPACSVYARAKTGATVITDVLRDNMFPPETFNAITSFQVFEHLPDPAGDLKKLYTMMAKGGVMLIEVPNIDTWTISVLRDKHRHFVQDHLNFFSKESLSKLLSNAGFEVVDSYRPARKMTVRHLTETWGGRYLPKPIVKAANSAVASLNWRDKIIAVNIGDIVSVVARKPL